MASILNNWQNRTTEQTESAGEDKVTVQAGMCEQIRCDSGSTVIRGHEHNQWQHGNNL